MKVYLLTYGVRRGYEDRGNVVWGCFHVLQTEENQAFVNAAQASAAGNTLTRMLELSK